MTWLWPVFIFLLLYVALVALLQSGAACARRCLPTTHPWLRRLQDDFPHRLAVRVLDKLQRLAVVIVLGGAVLLTLFYS